MGFLEFITGNLAHVLPILIVGVLGFAITLERIMALYFIYPVRNVEDFFEKIASFVSSGKMQDASALCERHSNQLHSKIVKAALSRAEMPESLIEDGLEMTMNQTRQAVQRRTGFLATIANVSTLLGLFGTILGLIHSFEAVGHADAQQKSALLSAGIATAMNSTMLGLAVAIPCMITFSILVSRSNTLISELEIASLRILDILKQRFYSSSDSTGAVAETKK